MDDYSRSTWSHLLSCKSNALHTFKAFSAMIENQFNTTIKSIRTNNGLEFTNSEATLFIQSEDIVHQKICLYTPQQNGAVKRKYKYLLETSRALLCQSKLTLQYWGECILTSTYLINKLTSSSLKNKCPFELLYQINQIIPILEVLGAYIFLPFSKSIKISLNQSLFLVFL